MTWRFHFHRFSLAAAAALHRLESEPLAFTAPAPPSELTELSAAYSELQRVFPASAFRARHAAEDFYDEFEKTLERLRVHGPRPELLELRLLRLDGLLDGLVPHGLFLPRRALWLIAGAAVAGVVPYVFFPTGLRSWLARLPDEVYLGLVGCILVAFSALTVALMLKGMRTGDRVGSMGVFLLMPSLLNLVLLFALAYWIPAGAPESCLNVAASRVDALYFSFATFTTTGFGDVYPTTSVCRTITTMQMMTTFVVITSLLGLYIGRAAGARR